MWERYSEWRTDKSLDPVCKYALCFLKNDCKFCDTPPTGAGVYVCPTWTWAEWVRRDTMWLPRPGRKGPRGFQLAMHHIRGLTTLRHPLEGPRGGLQAVIPLTPLWSALLQSGRKVFLSPPASQHHQQLPSRQTDVQDSTIWACMSAWPSISKVY